jgi:hypothetical protein
MTYNTPELLSVGTAQNFVLGARDLKSPDAQETNCDDHGQEIYAQTGLLDGNCW